MSVPKKHAGRRGVVFAACGNRVGDEPRNARGSVSAGGAGSALPEGSEKVNLDPKDFTIDIDNPYFPMKPGNKWVYAEADTEGKREKVVVEVTDKVKTIASGVKARVIRDTASPSAIVRPRDFIERAHHQVPRTPVRPVRSRWRRRGCPTPRCHPGPPRRLWRSPQWPS